MSNPLFKKKPWSCLLREQADAGEHTLSAARPLSLTALGVERRGIFVMTGLAPPISTGL